MKTYRVKWPLAIAVDLLPEKNGVTRLVVLSTATGLTKGAVNNETLPKGGVCRGSQPPAALKFMSTVISCVSI